MNDSRHGTLIMVFAVIVLGGTAVFVAKHISVVAAVIYCLGALGWLGFSYWFMTGPEDDPQTYRDSATRYQQYAKQIPSSFDSPEHGEIVRSRVKVEREKKARMQSGRRKSLPPPDPKPMENSGYRQTVVESIVEIQKLVNKTNSNLSRYQTVMNKRLNKNSGTEHRGLISARRIIMALDERIEQLKRAVDNYDNGRDDREATLALLKSPLVIPHDPLTALPGEEPVPPIQPEAFEATLKVLCKQIARKPSFLQLLGGSGKLR